MSSPIGIFDTGVGGLTVMQEVLRELPNENIVYFADTARCPYGNHPPEVIVRYVLESAEFLKTKNIKLLVVACFTAASHAFDALQERLSIPVIGVIENCLKEVPQNAKRIAILATNGTIQSGVIQKALIKKEPSTQIFPVACPLFTPLIEEGLLDHAATRLIVAHYLGVLQTQGLDAALLACTHYPLIRPLIQEYLGPSVPLVEPSKAIALETKERLRVNGLFNSSKERGNHTFYTSGDPEKFRKLTNMILSIAKNKNMYENRGHNLHFWGLNDTEKESLVDRR
jgi:glutamate racemase